MPLGRSPLHPLHISTSHAKVQQSTPFPQHAVTVSLCRLLPRLLRAAKERDGRGRMGSLRSTDLWQQSPSHRHHRLPNPRRRQELRAKKRPLEETAAPARNRPTVAPFQPVKVRRRLAASAGSSPAFPAEWSPPASPKETREIITVGRRSGAAPKMAAAAADAVTLLPRLSSRDLARKVVVATVLI